MFRQEKELSLKKIILALNEVEIMKKFWINLICSFIPFPKKRKSFRAKLLHKKINIPQTSNIEDHTYTKNHIEIEPEDKKRINLSIQGENNTIIVKKLNNTGSGYISIFIAGNNCKITLQEGILVSTGLKSEWDKYILILE